MFKDNFVSLHMIYDVGAQRVCPRVSAEHQRVARGEG